MADESFINRSKPTEMDSSKQAAASKGNKLAHLYFIQTHDLKNHNAKKLED